MTITLSTFLPETFASKIGDLYQSLVQPSSKFIKADGSWVSRITYPALYEGIKQTYSTKNVPSASGGSYPSSPGSAMQAIAWSPDGMKEAHAQNTPLKVYNWASGSPVLVSGMSLGLSSCFAVAWSPNSEILATGGTGTFKLQFWNWNGGSPLAINPATQPGNTVYGVAWSADGRYTYVYTASGTIEVYDWNTGVPVKVTFGGAATGFSAAGAADCMRVSKDGRWLVVIGNQSPSIVFYDLNVSATSPTRLSDPGSLPTSSAPASLAISPDSRYVFCGFAASPYYRIYDLSTGAAVASSIALASYPAAAATGADFSNDGTYLAIPNSAFIFSFPAGTQTTWGNPSVSNLNKVKFSPDDKFLTYAYSSAVTMAYVTHMVNMPGRFQFQVPSITYNWIRGILD